MDELKKALAEADDDYLIGISNKGILKRAYKDLETAAVNMGFIDESAEITVDNAQCIIKPAIAESVCSCPSRTICRHIITAVLWLKREFRTDEPNQEQTEKAAPAIPETKESLLAAGLREYPVEDLKKAMKKQYYNSFIEKARVGVLPQMDEGTTVTADIYEDNVTVKLLYPLGYSACTCHSKELCKHKAAVILAWKLKHKVITLESLLPDEEKKSVDVERLKNCARNCRIFLEKLLSDGLVRTADNISESVEAKALICHNADFPNGEKLMREIGNRLRAYAEHSPEFSTEKLFTAIMDSYILMSSVENETDEKKLNQLSGKFKSSYTVTENIDLLPVAQRKLSSIAGYEGDIYYFINKNSKGDTPSFLTFSDIRPTFYENNRRSQISNAPWGLYGTCSVLMNFEMRLVLPKLSGIKLSSSSDTQAYQICKPNLDQPAVYNRIYTDFRKMIEDSFIHTDSESETLVMLLPERIISSGFNEIEQTNIIIIEDSCSQRIKIKARYKSKSKDFFEQLSSVGKTMLENPEKTYVIFGSAYIENGECSIFPIAVFDNINAAKPEHKTRETNGSNVYGSFLKMFCGIMDVLCDMTECGVNSFDLYTQISDSADECERSGFSVLSEKLRILSDRLSAKKHTYSNDNTDIIRLIGEIYSYLSTGIEKTELKSAVENLYQREDDKNEFIEQRTK